MEVANSEISGSSNSYLSIKKHMRPLNDSLHNIDLIIPMTRVAFSGSVKYKGVVKQQNGHWGAQIYINQIRIWLGTFKSALEAAEAYDSASMKLKGTDANSRRNIPESDFTVHELAFQRSYTTEAVLNMIKEGSYPHKFRDFLRIQSQIGESIDIKGSKQSLEDEESNEGYSCKQLFQKELTRSDVGNLNRLVIPKRYALKYLPFSNIDGEKGETSGGVEYVEIVFYDRAMRQWKFRYCYWKSSQSFVFTDGWKRLVKEKNLKHKDIIVFYSCHVRSKKFLMVDVQIFTNDGYVVDEKVNETVLNRFEEKWNVEKNFISSKLETKEITLEENKREVMLFGVNIREMFVVI